MCFMEDNLPFIDEEDFDLFIESTSLDYDNDLFLIWDKVTLEVLFGIEQSCNEDGELLPLAVRSAWLRRFSPALQKETEAMLAAMPDEARDELVWVFFWVVRLSRMRETGLPKLQLPDCFRGGEAFSGSWSNDQNRVQ